MGVGGGRLMGGGGEGGFRPKRENKTICIHLLFMLMLYVKFQVPSSSGSLVLTQTKGVMDR